MPPAARLTDMHTCPVASGPVPHVGGPVISPGCISVQVGGKSAARVGDFALCAGPLDTISSGSSSVFIGGLPAARAGDKTAHGGLIVSGCLNVIIGD